MEPVPVIVRAYRGEAKRCYLVAQQGATVALTSWDGAIAMARGRSYPVGRVRSYDVFCDVDSVTDGDTPNWKEMRPL